MALKRVIPCLDVDAGRVVKGTNFVGLRDAGDPVELAARYDAEGADELVFLDITASHERRETIVELARRTADNVFIPFTIGGGIRSVDDAQAVLDAGADKVSVNSAALARPELIAELRRCFGTQCVVIAIDAKRRAGGWDVYVNGGRQLVEGHARPRAPSCSRPASSSRCRESSRSTRRTRDRRPVCGTRPAHTRTSSASSPLTTMLRHIFTAAAVPTSPCRSSRAACPTATTRSMNARRRPATEQHRDAMTIWQHRRHHRRLDEPAPLARITSPIARLSAGETEFRSA